MYMIIWDKNVLFVRVCCVDAHGYKKCTLKSYLYYVFIQLHGEKKLHVYVWSIDVHSNIEKNYTL